MAKDYLISEITDGLKATMPILRAHLRSQAGLDASTSTIEVQQKLTEFRKSVDEHHRHLRGAYSDVENSLSTWLDRASQARPEQRGAYAAGLDAIERKIEALNTIAGLHERDEARQAKRA